MPPLRLTDAELDAVMTAAQPIAPDRRDAFVQEVANLLASCVEVGPGTVHRAIALAQREFFNPPDLSVGVAGRSSKYR
jgi:hypothetical protein